MTGFEHMSQTYFDGVSKTFRSEIGRIPNLILICLMQLLDVFSAFAKSLRRTK